SDRIGRKPLLFISLLLGLIFFRPIFTEMYKTADVKNKVENIAAEIIDRKTDLLNTKNNDSLVTTTTTHFYTDGTTSKEVKNETISFGKKGRFEIVESIKMNNADKWLLILLIVVMMIITSMSYGPLAAFLVEMFPLKIRYTSMS